MSKHLNLVTDSTLDFSDIEPVNIYAYRVVRRFLLKYSCEEGHPVLVLENSLVERAKLKLQEFLLIAFPNSLIELKSNIITAIKQIISSKIIVARVDSKTKRNLLNKVNKMSMDDIIPIIN